MAVQGNSNFGTRKSIDINKLNELINREIKYFRNYKIYRPNFGAKPLTGKFYAAHDDFSTLSDEEKNKVENYTVNVEQSRAKGPHCKYPDPVTENQVYGWYSKPLVALDKNGKRFYFPQYESENTKIEAAILKCNPRAKKSK